MDWSSTFAEMEAILDEEKIQGDIAELLAVNRQLIDTSGQQVFCPKDTYAVVEERSLVRKVTKDGNAYGYFFVKCVLKTNMSESEESSTLAKVKIMYSLAGEYMDEFILPRYS